MVGRGWSSAGLCAAEICKGKAKGDRGHPAQAHPSTSANLHEECYGPVFTQDFDFPETSCKIRSSRDGRYLLATGTYKPRMKVFELDELSMKFARTTDAENVDFQACSPA
jgi:hypothetical protein